MIVVQLLDLLLNLFLFAICQIHSTVMVHETLKVEHVLVECMLCLQATLFFLLVFALLRLLVINVALVISTSGCSMCRPLPKAKPAKFMTTTTSFGAHHVVAALILFYG